MKNELEFYKDSEGKWRWIIFANNGRIINKSYRRYANKQDCINNAKKNGYS